MNTKYDLVASDIENKIHGNIYKDVLPNERKLSEMYGVSRNTINLALKKLERSNLIYRKRGSGTYIRKTILVPDSKENFHDFIDGFTKAFTNENFKAETKIISFEMYLSDKSVSEKLDIDNRTPLFEVCRLREIDGHPAIYETNIVPIQLLPNLNPKIMQGSLFKYAEEQLKQKIVDASIELSAPKVQGQVAEALGIKDKDSFIVKSEGIVYLEKGSPLELVINYHVPKYFTFKMDRFKY